MKGLGFSLDGKLIHFFGCSGCYNGGLNHRFSCEFKMSSKLP